MTSKIRLLDEITINKIAAGEVIENPASVVKELVENSLDAGANEITIEIKGGGRQLIRISDNGCGMNPDDALLCLERHATSKIREVEELSDLVTMGFRGEAIPSIASISKFTLLTCPAAEEGSQSSKGTLVIVEGGKVLSCSAAARAPGTTIEVKSLFFNVPARKKFLKSPTIDSHEILKTVSLMALGNPEIKFQLISDEKILIATPPNPESSFIEILKNRSNAILGQDFVQNTACIYTKDKNASIEVEGLIGLPEYNRPNRMGQYLFINRRAVVSPVVSYAIKEGYHSALAQGRFPVFVIHLTLPGELVDINVHPQKREVRLRHENLIKELLIKAVQSTLTPTPRLYEPSSPLSSSPVFAEAFKSSFSRFSEIQEPTWIFQPRPFTPEAPFFPPDVNRMVEKSMTNDELVNDKRTLLPRLENPAPQPSLLPPKPQSPRVLATIPRYILLENGKGLGLASEQEGLLLVDQKAAHSRIVFEDLLAAEKGKALARQPLLIPHQIEVSPLEAELLRNSLTELCQIGIHIEEFGATTFLVHALPKIFGNSDVEKLISEILQDLQNDPPKEFLQRINSKKIALAANRSAISNERRLDIEEAQSIIDQLFQCQNSSHCPLGKTIWIHLSTETLSRFFQKH